jgi:hypothetical protein
LWINQTIDKYETMFLQVFSNVIHGVTSTSSTNYIILGGS